MLRRAPTVPGEREPGAPVLGVGLDQAAAERGEAAAIVRLRIRALEAGEYEVGALRRFFDHALPGRDGAVGVTLIEPHVAQVQVRGDGMVVELDRGLEPACGFGVVHALERIEAQLVLEERQDLLVSGL